MVDQLQVDMIVKAIAQGFSELNKDVTSTGAAFDKSSKLIVDSSGKVQTVTEATTTSVVKGSRQQEQAFERVASEMVKQTNLIIQKQQELQRQQEQLASTMSKLAVGFGAAAIAGGVLMGSSIKLAARVETLGVVTVQLGKNVGMTESQVRQLEAAVMDQGITMQAARQSIARMVQGNIDLAHATDLARLSQDAAVIAGINSSEAFERLTTAIATGQLRMLRTLGIMGTFERSYKVLADQLGKTTEELTELEKVQARTNMVIEAGTNIAGAYESAMETAGKKITSLDRHLEESSRILGEMWLPAYATVIDLLTEGLKVWEDTDKAVQNATSAILGYGTAMAAVMAIMFAAIAAVVKLKLVMAAAVGEFTALAGAGLATAGMLVTMVGLIAAVVVGWAAAIQKGIEMRRTLEDIEKQALKGKKTYTEYRAEIDKQAEVMGILLDANGDAIVGYDKLGNAITATQNYIVVMTEAEYEAKIAADELAKSMELLDAKTAGLSGVTTKTTDAIEGLNDEAELLNLRMRIHAGRMEDAQKATAALARETAWLKAEMEILAAGLGGTLQKASENYVKTMEDIKDSNSELIAEKQKLLKQGYDPEGEKIQEINEALGKNAEAQREARSAIEETTAQMIYQQVASSLSTEAAIGLARAMGILSEQDALVALIAEEATVAFDANTNQMIDAGAEAEKYASFMSHLSDVVANLIQAGAEVTMENVAAAMAATSARGEDVAGVLPDVVTGFEDIEVAANDGVGKAEELFDIVVDDSIEAIIKAGEVKTSVEEIGASAETTAPKVVQMFTDADTAMRNSVIEAYKVKTALEDIAGTYTVTIKVNTVGNLPQGFQHGGEMLPGMLGLVGEAGPELFVAPAKGTIIPHSQSTTLLAGLNRQTSMQVVGVNGETNISKDSYQDIFLEGDTFMVEGDDMGTIKAVAATYKRDRLSQFVRG